MPRLRYRSYLEAIEEGYYRTFSVLSFKSLKIKLNFSRLDTLGYLETQ